MLWFGLQRRIDELELDVDSLEGELEQLRSLPAEVNDIAERANRLLARLNQRARREALDEGDDDREQLQLVEPGTDPVSERIRRQRARMTREEG